MSDAIMSELLREADAVINGPRRAILRAGGGELRCDWRRCSTVVLRKKLKEPLDEHDVGLMMLSHKLVRESNAHERDNLRDLAGYAALTERVSVKGGE
jgi:hypothetical protein